MFSSLGAALAHSDHFLRLFTRDPCMQSFASVGKDAIKPGHPCHRMFFSYFVHAHCAKKRTFQSMVPPHFVEDSLV